MSTRPAPRAGAPLRPASADDGGPVGTVPGADGPGSPRDPGDHDGHGGSGDGSGGDGEPGEGDRLVELARVPDQVEGQILVGMLQAHGVQALLSGVESAGYSAVPGLSRPRVLVRRRDLPLARQLLHSTPPDLGDAPWTA